jgi:hypothetical protein
MQLLSLLKRRQEFLCLARIVTAARELINHAVLLCKVTLAKGDIRLSLREVVHHRVFVHGVLDSMLTTYKRSRLTSVQHNVGRAIA